jgi:ferredoxin
MCEFCVQHGEGKKWYLDARNYARDLLSDVRRRKMITDFFSKPGGVSDDAAQLEKLSKLPPVVRRAISSAATRKMKKQHFGQVLPIEDVERIFGFVNFIARVPCICRHSLLGKEARYCYGISLDPSSGLEEVLGETDNSFISGPDSPATERLTREEALEAFAEHEKEGLCHTVWTFMTPFIGGICNCDRADCMAMRSTVVHDVKVMFRAEYVASANPDICTGCRSCMRGCQFGALGYSATNKKVVVDQLACYGCGVCRSMCRSGALSLVPRSEAPAVASVW